MTVEPADLLLALAQHLDDLGFARWSPTGAYPKNLTKPVVTIGKLPQDIVSAVALHYYDTDPDPFTVVENPLHAVQLEFRDPGPSPIPVIRHESTVRGLLHMTSGTWPGGVTPLSVVFSYAAPADPDNGNWTKAANYEIRLNPGD